MQRSDPVTAPFPQHNALQDASVVGIKASFLWVITMFCLPTHLVLGLAFLSRIVAAESITEFVCRHVFISLD